MITRSGRPSSVRATITLPSRITSRWPYGARAVLDPVGDLPLVAADRFDVDQRAEQRDDVAVQVQRLQPLPGTPTGAALAVIGTRSSAAAVGR